MFDIKRPCKNCPFRKGHGEKFRLPAGRLQEIKTAVAFQCHKTFNSQPKQCAGLMSILEREGTENAIMQVARRFGTDLSGLDPDHEAYGSWSEAVAAHCGESVSHD